MSARAQEIAAIRAKLDALERAPSYRPGELREVRETDQSGRTITRFEGDPTVCWQPFISPARALSAINTRGKP